MVCIYISGLSLRRVSERLSCFIRRNHVSIWNWVQKYHPKKISSSKRKILEFIVDETIIKVGSEYIWLWITIEPKNKEILAVFLAKNIKEKKHADSRKVSLRRSQDSWKASRIYRWWNLVPNGL